MGMTQGEALAKGNIICTTLREMGQFPVWLEVTEDGENICIGFDIIAERERPWTKAFNCEAHLATPEAYMIQLKIWKAKVRKDLAMNSPSAVVKDVIRHWGMQRIMGVLA